jgi:proteic killer suppression protein
MIKSYRSKPLETFATTGNGSKLPVKNHARVRRILAALDAATVPEDMNLPGYRFHGLEGKPKRYAVDASGNYRITWGWEEPSDAVHVDLEDYH